MLNRINLLFSLLITIGMVTFSSCSKDNMDITINENGVDPEEMVCDPIIVGLYQDGNTIAAELDVDPTSLSFEWSDGSTNSTLEVLESGTYSLTVTDENECVGDNSISVTVDDPTTCDDNTLTVTADNGIDFSEESEGHLFLVSCDQIGMGNAPFTHNYIVVDAAWVLDNSIAYGYPHDGIPGITFGSNGVPSAGDVLTPYGQEFLFESSAGNRYDTDNLTITIEEAGDQVGDVIRGTVSGTVVHQNDDTDIGNVNGTFCVEIASVCD